MIKALDYLRHLSGLSRKEALRAFAARAVACGEGEPAVLTDPGADVGREAAARAPFFLNGARLEPIPYPYFYVALNKPRGYESSNQSGARPSVLALLPEPLRLGAQIAGRLDESAEGLLIVTNDGRFNHRLTSPRSKAPKTYVATLRHPATEDFLRALASPIALRDGATVQALSVKALGEKEVEVVLGEGKYHQIRRMVGACSNRLEGLRRVAVGKLALGDLPSGQYRFFRPEAVWGGKADAPSAALPESTGPSEALPGR